MNTSVLIAIAGLITTAAAPIIQSLVTTRQQERARLRELRIEAYTDASLFAQSAESVVGHYTDPLDRSSSRLAQPPPADGITARIRLLAPPIVAAAWSELLSAWEALDYTLDTDTDLRRGKLLDRKDCEVQQLMAAISNFYAAASPHRRGALRAGR